LSKENPDHSLFEQNRSGLSSSDPEAQGVEAAPGGGTLSLSTQRPRKQCTIHADLSRSTAMFRHVHGRVVINRPVLRLVTT
jgi:hypothetical protein